MKKKISVRLFFTVLGRGIWQALRWVAGMFGIEDDKSLGKAARRVYQCSIAFITFALAVLAGMRVYDYAHGRYFKRAPAAQSYDCDVRYLCGDYVLVETYDGRSDCYIKNYKTGEKVLEGLDWVNWTDDSDSLVLYRDQAGKYGFFNRYTGENQIEAQFQDASAFKGGFSLASMGEEYFFIDRHGKRAFDKSLPCMPADCGYGFKGRYSKMIDSNWQLGLIDKSGEWALEPEYDAIEACDNDFWIVIKDNRYGVISDSLQVVLPLEYDYIEYESEGFFATKDGGTKLYAEDGSVKIDFVVLRVRNLYYETEELDENGKRIEKEADCISYYVGLGEGLMDKGGRPLTKAVYSSIVAISKGLFLCEVGENECVILDAKGRNVN